MSYLNITTEERKEIIQLSLRETLGNFPVVGSVLNNIFFEFRSRVKQERLNKLVEVLEKDLANLDLNPQKLQTEENLDLFETIFKKVADTRSEQKREYLKNILVTGIKQTDQVEYCELFAQHILSFHPKELEILSAHLYYLLGGKGPLSRKNELFGEMEQNKIWHQAMNTPQDFLLRSQLKPGFKPRPPHITSAEYNEAKKMLELYIEEIVAEKFGISEDELKFFLQNLLSKGLLRDDGTGAIDTDPITIMSITSLGLKFLNFIKL